MHVLAVEPFYGGSHRAFLDGLVRHSRHRWSLVTGKPVHWKWRCRSAALDLAGANVREAGQSADAILVSDMLDLPTWRGMLRDPVIASKPTVVYFHENQWTYPLSPQARVDHHFGYTNLLSSLAADACWFNSDFHRREFIRASEAFVRRMPDSRAAHDFDRLARISQVLPPGFDPPDSLPPREPSSAPTPLHIGWVSRWEYDKRPDRLVDLVQRLEKQTCDFRLILLGPRPNNGCSTLQTLSDRFGHRIARSGFAVSREEYWHSLRSMDVVVSTADHEFFGIAICEAIWAGAVPVLPRRLSYPELVSDHYLYDDLSEAADRIQSLCDPEFRQQQRSHVQTGMEPLTMNRTAERIDLELDRLAEASGGR